MVITKWLHSEAPRLVGSVCRPPRHGMAQGDAAAPRSVLVETAPRARAPACGKNLKTPSLSASRLNQKRVAPHHTSPPKDPMYFADFCARMIERYAPRQQQKAVA
jgi:hypothetical protein